MPGSRIAAVRRGVEAAMVASVPQVLLPKLEEYLFLSGRGEADLGPHLIDAVAARTRLPLPEDLRWLGASTFHFGYAAFRGALYALLHERKPMSPWKGGLGLAALIYMITFPPWGGAVLLGAEPPPRQRSWRKELVLATAPLVFGLGTALLYGRGPRRTFRERMRAA